MPRKPPTPDTGVGVSQQGDEEQIALDDVFSELGEVFATLIDYQAPDLANRPDHVVIRNAFVKLGRKISYYAEVTA